MVKATVQSVSIFVVNYIWFRVHFHQEKHLLGYVLSTQEIHKSCDTSSISMFLRTVESLRSSTLNFKAERGLYPR